MSLSRESPFRHKVVYSVHDGCSLWQKSIHQEQGNTMLFSSISVVNGQLFLRCSIVWRHICWTDYWTIFVRAYEWKKKYFCIEKTLKSLLVSGTRSPGSKHFNIELREVTFGTHLCKLLRLLVGYCETSVTGSHARLDHNVNIVNRRGR